MVKIITIRGTNRDYIVDDKIYYDTEYGMIVKKVVTLNEDGEPTGILTVSPMDVVETHEAYTEEEIERLEDIRSMASTITENVMRQRMNEIREAKEKEGNNGDTYYG